MDAYFLLQRSDGVILLLERSGTGYADGRLCPRPGGLRLAAGACLSGTGLIFYGSGRHWSVAWCGPAGGGGGGGGLPWTASRLL